MNGAHLHLTVNNVPIFATFTAGALFTIALLVRARAVWVRAGLLALAVGAAGALAAFLSGDAAVDVIRGMPRTSNLALEEHHLRATVASSLLGLAVVVAAIVFVRARHRGGAFGRRAVASVLAVTIAAAAAFAWTGLAGGRVNHPELQHPADVESGPATHD
jgi:hypothetical protein